MADIDSIISGVAGNTRADFSGLADAYFKGQEESRKSKEFNYAEKMRNVFSDGNGGLPRDSAGNIDGNKLYERILQSGGVPAIDAAGKAAETGFLQDRYRNAPAVDSVLRGDQGPAAPGPAIVSPPSANRTADTKIAPPLNRGGLVPRDDRQTSAPAPTAAPTGRMATIQQVLVAQNIPNDQLGAASASIARQLGLDDPNAPLNLQDPQIRNVLVPAVQQLKRAGIGQVVSADAPQGGPMPQASQPPMAFQGSTVAPQAPQAQAQSMQPPVARGVPQPAPEAPGGGDPTLGGLIPPGYSDPGAYVRRLEAVAGSGRVLPDQLKVLQARIEGIRKAMEPTPDIKNARAAGMSVKDYLDRGDAATTDRAVLTGSILPKLDESQKAAQAARDEVTAIHRARDQLDAQGGIFTGTGADVRLKLAKAATLLGVPNSDKIVNTEAFGAAIGARVLSLVKGLGAGAGISNADRDYAAGMAGGNIKLDEGAIRRILEIGETAARSKIDQHNKLTTNTLKSAKALEDYGSVFSVEAPGAYRRSAQGNPVAGPMQFSSQMDPRARGAKSGDIITDENGKKFRVR